MGYGLARSAIHGAHRHHWLHRHMHLTGKNATQHHKLCMMPEVQIAIWSMHSCYSSAGKYGKWAIELPWCRFRKCKRLLVQGFRHLYLQILCIFMLKDMISWHHGYTSTGLELRGVQQTRSAQCVVSSAAAWGKKSTHAKSHLHKNTDMVLLRQRFSSFKFHLTCADCASSGDDKWHGTMARLGTAAINQTCGDFCRVLQLGFCHSDFCASYLVMSFTLSDWLCCRMVTW